MKPNQIIASILLLATFLSISLLPARVQAQVGDPFEITFGQPNIWSLEQAHYLLAQMRERSMRIRANELENLDPNSAEASRINLIRQMFGLNAQFTQRPDFGPGLTTAAESPTPVPSPEPVPSPAVAPSPLDGTILSSLLSGDFLRKLNSDSKLNATTRLDNHVQLQYEIIAKQLTLLRDEVGPDERLVFLELPQTIYSSGTDTKGKVVQTYWEIAGFTEYNREADLDKSLEKIKNYFIDVEKAYTQARGKYDEITVKNPRYKELLESVKTIETNHAAEVKTCADDADCKRRKEEELKQRQEALNTFRNDPANKEKVAEFDKLKGDFDKKEGDFNQIKGAIKELEQRRADLKYNETVRQAREALDRISQRGAAPNSEIVERVITNGKFAISKFGDNKPADLNTEITNRRMRTVDIIPRQSSLNVNDIQETVKSSVLGGAFSFLFGLGARTNFQRQRDTFEQYLHQDIYASGFGKGENIFGWTFGPVPGTKRVASGVRTTYAVLVVPRSAEALVLNARGCYYSRLKFQPRRVMDPTNENAYKDDGNGRRWQDDDVRECSDKKQYILPVPNAGDANGFWITGVDYTPVEKAQKVVASIKGKNFTSQVGVLVNGVPLQQVVELTRKLPSRDLETRDFCENDICGRYEIIDAEEISMVFKMPKDFEGTPEISVVGPGRAVNLRDFPIKVTAHGTKFENEGDTCERCKINEDKIPFMFGTRASNPDTKLSITDLQVFPNGTTGAGSSAFLSGTKFTGLEDIYVNGDKIEDSAPPAAGGTPTLRKEFISSKQYKIIFDLQGRDTVTVLVRQCREEVAQPNGQKKIREIACTTLPTNNSMIATVVRTFQVNTSTQFIITSANALRYDKTKKEMFIRIEGTGLENVKLFKINDKPVKEEDGKEIPVSSREMLVRLVNPSATVKITLKNSSGVEISAVVIRPPDVEETDEP